MKYFLVESPTVMSYYPTRTNESILGHKNTAIRLHVADPFPYARLLKMIYTDRDGGSSQKVERHN